MRLVIAVTIAGVLLPLQPVLGQSDQLADGPVAATIRARDIVQRAVREAGGLDALRGIGSVRRVMTLSNADPGQGHRPVASAARIPPVLERRRVVQWTDYAQSRQYAEDVGAIFGGQPFRLRTVTTASFGFQANDSLRVVTDFSANSLSNRLQAGTRSTPEGLLLAAAERPEALRWIGRRTQSDRSYDVVAFAEGPGTMLTMEFDAENGLLAAQIGVGTGASLGDQDVRREYADWRPVRGSLRLPFRMRDVRNGVQFSDTVLDSLTLDRPVPDSLLVRPDGYGTEAPRSGEVLELAPGVFAIMNFYNSLAVVFDTYVAVVEPAVSEGMTRRTLAVLDSLAPGKPVRYVVATHFHSDHVAGVRGFLSRGATLLGPPDAGIAAERIASAPRRIRPDQVVADSVRFTPVTSLHALREGERELRLIPIGPSPHAEQMLIAYVPEAGILYVADVLDLAVPSGRVAMGGHDTRHLLDQIQRMRLSVHIVVPTHGRLGTLDDARAASARFAP